MKLSQSEGLGSRIVLKKLLRKKHEVGLELGNVIENHRTSSLMVESPFIKSHSRGLGPSLTVCPGLSVTVLAYLSS